MRSCRVVLHALAADEGCMPMRMGRNMLAQGAWHHSAGPDSNKTLLRVWLRDAKAR